MKVVLANSVGRDLAGNWIIHSPSRWTEAVRARENWFVYYPWELACLSSLLKAGTGHEVKLVDGCLLEYTAAGLAARIVREKPDMLVIESATRVFRDNLSAALEVKRATGAHLVFVGQHASAFPDSVLAAGADAAVIGEYEETLLCALRDAESGRGLPSGICGRAAAPVDFAALPWPEDEDVSRLDYGRPGEPSSEFLEIQMYATRGCPRACRFCVAANLYYARPCHRCRNAEDVVAEIAHLKAKYPAMEGVFFDEESHNANRAFTLDLCRRIRAAGLDGLHYEAMCDFMFFDAEVFDAMAAAGYYKVRFGVETVDETVGGRLGKYIAPDRLVAGLELARAAGLKTYGTFMLGLPGSGRESDLKTIDFMKRALDRGLLYNAQISIAVPQPGTPFYGDCIAAGLVRESDFDYLDGSHCVVRSPDYPADEVARMLERALRVRNRSLLVRNLHSPAGLVANLRLKISKHGIAYTFRKVLWRMVSEIRALFSGAAAKD